MSCYSVIWNNPWESVLLVIYKANNGVWCFSSIDMSLRTTLSDVFISKSVGFPNEAKICNFHPYARRRLSTRHFIGVPPPPPPPSCGIFIYSPLPPSYGILIYFALKLIINQWMSYVFPFSDWINGEMLIFSGASCTSLRFRRSSKTSTERTAMLFY